MHVESWAWQTSSVKGSPSPFTKSLHTFAVQADAPSPFLQKSLNAPHLSSFASATVSELQRAVARKHLSFAHLQVPSLATAHVLSLVY